MPSVALCPWWVPGYNRSFLDITRPTPVRLAVGLSLRSVLDTLKQLRARHRRRLAFLAPAIERRRPRIQAEDYAARHSIEHTLDRKAELRRLAPTWLPAARRYHQLLTYELDGLREMVASLRAVTGGRELEECLGETAVQIEQLETELAWCRELLPRGEPQGRVLIR